MTLHPWIRAYVKKYSFIVDTKFTRGLFYIYYERDGKRLFKRLPYRANKQQLEHAIETIKQEIDYYTTKNKYWADKLKEEDETPLVVKV